MTAELTLIYDEQGRHKCIGCGICQMNCPNGTIKLETTMIAATTKYKIIFATESIIIVVKISN